MPSTASARLSQTASVLLLLLLSSRDLLQLGVEFVEDRLGVDTLVLLVGHLDPLVNDRPGALLRLGLHRGIRGDDAGARRLERVQAHLVGLVPRLAVGARGVLEAVLLDDRL